MSMRQLHDLSRVYLEQVATEAFVDPEQGEAPSGRSPLQNVSDHPKASVRKKAVGAFKKQMGKEYGGTWKSRTKDPVAEAAKPDYLDFDKDGNKKESMKKALKDKKEVTEAVRGQDTEMRKAASQERQAERKERGGAAPKIPGREGPSAGKSYADYQQVSMRAHDKATRGKFIPGMVKNESLDPVGREDADIDNDGDTDKSDKYLHKRRKAIGKAIATRKESFSNWRHDLAEVMDKPESDTEEHKQIKEKKNINNKIVINPEFKEAVEELGGVLLETVELEEGYKPIGREKESAMYRRAGNLARTSLSSRGKKKEEAQTKSAKIVSAITRQKEKERFDRIGQSPTHNEEVEQLDEISQKTATRAYAARATGEYEYDTNPRDQTKSGKYKSDVARERIKKKFGDKAAQHAGRAAHSMTFGREGMRPVKEEVEIDEAQQSFPFKKVEAQKEKARKGSVYGRDTGNKPVPQVSDKEKRETTRFSKMQSAYEKAKRAKQEADKSRRSSTFYKDTHPASAPKMKKANEEFELDEKTLTPAETKKKEQIVKSMKKSAGDFEKRYPGRGKEVMYATATKQAKKLAEADMPQTTQPSEKRNQTQQKQRLLQILQQKERAVRSGLTDISASYEPEGEVIDERRKEDKVAGTPRKPRDKAFEIVKGSIRKMEGTPVGQRKKEPGKKPPKAGEYGATKSPAQKVAIRRAAAQRAQDMMHSPRD